MPTRIRWTAFPLAIVVVAVLGMTFAQTTAASAYDAVGPASTAATVNASASLDTVPASVPGGPATGTLRMLDMDDDGGWDMGSGWWIVMPIMMVIFWGAIIAVVVWGIRQFTGDRRRDGSPLDIAKERLARGEITKEEFDRIRSDLA
jgi:putative membrane protein